MSQAKQNEDETQPEIQNEDTQDMETQDLESSNLEQENEVVATAAPQKKKPEKKDLVMREPGKTLFPMSRVQKIIKADKVHINASFIPSRG